MTKQGLKLGCALSALTLGMAPMAAAAQSRPAPAPAPAPAPTPAPRPARAPVPAPLQDAGQEDDGGEDIVVKGELRGAVPGDIKPELSLDPADIRTYGASNVSDLITALAPQIGSGSGRGDEQPVILLSGRRSNIAEIRDLPTEAIERIDILPEEAALQYGYGANQKVINFVLRRRFQAVTTVLEGAMPTAGGNSGQSGNVNIQKIGRGARVQLDVKYNQNSGILESERGVTRAPSSLFDTRGNIIGLTAGSEIDPALSGLAGSTVTIAGVPDSAAATAPTLAGFAANANRPNATDLSPYRTLSGGGGNAGLSAAPLKNLAITGVYTPAISDKVTATLTFGLTARQTEALLGLPSATLRLPAGDPFSPFARDVQLLRYYDDQLPLSRSTDNRTATAQLSLNGDNAPWIRSWRWSLQASYNRSITDTLASSGIDPSRMQAALDARDPGFNPFGPIPGALIGVRAAQTSQSTASDAQINFATFGTLFKLPAGNVTTSLRLAGRTNDQHSQSFIPGNALIPGAVRIGDVSRDSGSVRGNISLPLTSRRLGVLDAIGDISVNANFEIEQLSDFGRLVTTGYGVNWSPIPQVRTIFSVTDDRGAPNANQLGDPILVTPNQRVFDFTRNESVDIIAITGGNPLLQADRRHVFNARAEIRPLTNTNLSINAAYSNSRFHNPTSSFPGPTAEIEAAFPDRFVRDASGRLVSIDYRPINYERRDHSELRWGINLSFPIPSPQAKRLQARRQAFQAAFAESRRTGQPLPPEFTAQLEQFRRLGQQQSLFGGNLRQQYAGQGQGQGQAQGQPPQDQRSPSEGRAPGDGQGPGAGGGFRGGGGGGRGGFGGGGRGGFGGGGGGNQIRFSLNHVWVFRDEILIRQGLPVINQLDGTSSQSIAAHQIDGTIAVKRDAWLIQANGNWQSGSQRMTGSLGSQTQLDFGSLGKVGLLAEWNPGQDVDFLLKHPWFRGARVQFRVDNLFDARQRVTDANGQTPSAYAPNLRDPIGRVVRLTFRKMFF